MNLRHIDPRSTDWMDAMLDGEWDGKLSAGTHKHGKRDVDQQGSSEAVQLGQMDMMAAHPTVDTGQEQGSRPPPVR